MVPVVNPGAAAVALCADRNIEVGVHVTLYSLLESARCPVRIHFIHKGYTDADLKRLCATLARFAARYELRPMRADDARFRDLSSTRGDRFTYVRLLLPELLEESRVLYLDCDLVVGVDAGALARQPLDGFALGASGIGEFRWSNDGALCRALGLEIEAPYFNAGVLLLDLDAWRRDGLTSRCLEFARQHAPRLATADQTVLNFIFYRKFKALQPEFNEPLYPDTPAVPANSDHQRIFHFVGTPKPWG